MPIQAFQILLDKEEVPYFSGEQISGKFIVVVADGYHHDGIFLKFEGHGMIKWKEESSCCEDTYVKQCIARKQYFETMFKYASQDELAEGTHIFPFEYLLPKKLPSSYATLTTSVWYKMEALIKKDPGKPRREVKIFSLRGILDLNDFPDLRNPMSKVKSKTLTGFFPPCFCNFHYVSIELKLLKRGFVPGDKIPCELAIFTESMPLTDVTLTLVQETTMSTREKTMVERRTVSKVILLDILAENGEDYRKWEKKISVPADILITSDVLEYDTIKIQSFVKFSVEAANFPYKVIQVTIPVVIGTVPLSKIKETEVEEEIDDFEYVNGSRVPKIVISDSPQVPLKMRRDKLEIPKIACDSNNLPPSSPLASSSNGNRYRVEPGLIFLPDTDSN